MSNFSAGSLAKLRTCDLRLQGLFAKVVQVFDCTITDGYRSNEAQQIAFNKGTSDKKPGESKHNHFPSLAVDVYPFPIDFNKKERFYYFAGYVMSIANEMGLKIRWGGDWDGDKDLYDQRLYDLVHFEIVE